MRCVFVKLPSYSAICVDGKKKTSVWLSSILTSPRFTSGPRYQCVAVSVSQLSLTTSQLSCRNAPRVAPPLSEVAGFWPTHTIPLTLPSAMAANEAMCEWSPRIFGCQSYRSEEHTSELQSQSNLVCRLLLEKKNFLLFHLVICRRDNVNH